MCNAHGATLTLLTPVSNNIFEKSAVGSGSQTPVDDYMGVHYGSSRAKRGLDFRTQFRSHPKINRNPLI